MRPLSPPAEPRREFGWVARMRRAGLDRQPSYRFGQRGSFFMNYRDREAWQALVMSQADLSAATRLTGIALASHLNFKTGALFPSIARMAVMTAQTPRAVTRQISALVAAGLIVRRGRKRGANDYSLQMPTACLPGIPPTGRSADEQRAGLSVHHSMTDGSHDHGLAGRPNTEHNIETEQTLKMKLMEFKRTIPETSWEVLFGGCRIGLLQPGSGNRAFQAATLVLRSLKKVLDICCPRCCPESALQSPRRGG
jgi:hypothetical protein